MIRTCSESYRKHSYSGPRKNMKYVRAQLRRYHGEGVTREKLWRKKKEMETTENEATPPCTKQKTLKTYSRKAPKEVSIAELSREDDKMNFEKELSNMYKEQHNQWSQDRILEVMNIIEEYNVARELNKARTSTHCYYWTHYEVIEEDGEEFLIEKRKQPTDPVVKVLPTEKYFDILYQLHEATNHGGRDQLKNAIDNKYYIPLWAIPLFLKYCAVCKSQRQESINDEENERTPRALCHGQINLIDKQNQPDGDHKWILHYQDVATKFNILRPLPSNSVKDVGQELLKIFSDIGPPTELSYKYLDFCESVVDEVKNYWKDLEIEVRLSDSDNKNDIEALLYSWMTEQKSFNWAFGVLFVQYKMNTTFDPVLERTPFKALFGHDPYNAV